ncbi:uncharacterized protein SCHCODRAFT_02581299 [Schizophyllum commune H4-8]|nr:uncharacterized protein SCHCODRAFT_02581299 [Schizophyllum commune H4-8]KAI5891494.1 hypothetical protein SCHCODRAFT_02581299 [Schizophyllum commune H4-8]
MNSSARRLAFARHPCISLNRLLVQLALLDIMGISQSTSNDDFGSSSSTSISSTQATDYPIASPLGFLGSLRRAWDRINRGGPDSHLQIICLRTSHTPSTIYLAKYAFPSVYDFHARQGQDQRSPVGRPLCVLNCTLQEVEAYQAAGQYRYNALHYDKISPTLLPLEILLRIVNVAEHVQDRNMLTLAMLQADQQLLHVVIGNTPFDPRRPAHIDELALISRFLRMVERLAAYHLEPVLVELLARILLLHPASDDTLAARQCRAYAQVRGFCEHIELAVSKRTYELTSHAVLLHNPTCARPADCAARWAAVMQQLSSGSMGLEPLSGDILGMIRCSVCRHNLLEKDRLWKRWYVHHLPMWVGLPSWEVLLEGRDKFYESHKQEFEVRVPRYRYVDFRAGVSAPST